ncbi:uncharacterized protein BDR25DRAFT_36011 [Lindgomyces ingoldianus]|uniref:Uncharacterized protein n=1 Tax=Lindgomyces ingoldianus TaxID=673940 RepID=A0ACB6QSM8_9PLEO|nr:uncharacterized protein BDR25DRAFT_36011 [Lindgomyces ingoldianus]KAF2470013.1 hypothetical protein BDR25DRAFT_36011 [Lindgomyces ingoldianus]
MKTTLIVAAIISLSFAAPARRPAVVPRAANLQTFTGALNGIAATPVVDSGNPDRPFQVKGDTFVNIGAALQRSCDQQFNACANAANGGAAGLSVNDCQGQKDQCDAASSGAAANAGNANAGNGNGNAGNANTGNANAGNAAPATGKSCKAKKH